MKKKKWNRVLAVLLAMVTAVSLLSACGSKSGRKKMQKQSQAETDEHIASVRLWQQKREKRRCRNNHGVLMEHKSV